MTLELWVTSLSDTPRLQYYDAETLPKYRYISKLIISPCYWEVSPIKLRKKLFNIEADIRPQKNTVGKSLQVF
jgi:hypothetical protein